MNLCCKYQHILFCPAPAPPSLHLTPVLLAYKCYTKISEFLTAINCRPIRNEDGRDRRELSKTAKENTLFLGHFQPPHAVKSPYIFVTLHEA